MEILDKKTRQNSLMLYLSDDEKSILDAYCNETGCTKSAIVRISLFNYLKDRGYPKQS